MSTLLTYNQVQNSEISAKKKEQAQLPYLLPLVSVLILRPKLIFSWRQFEDQCFDESQLHSVLMEQVIFIIVFLPIMSDSQRVPGQVPSSGLPLPLS